MPSGKCRPHCLGLSVLQIHGAIYMNVTFLTLRRKFPQISSVFIITLLVYENLVRIQYFVIGITQNVWPVAE